MNTRTTFHIWWLSIQNTVRCSYTHVLAMSSQLLVSFSLVQEGTLTEKLILKLINTAKIKLQYPPCNELWLVALSCACVNWILWDPYRSKDTAVKFTRC